MTTLDVDLLRTFVHVADMRSFTAAGSALGATQSAVSVRLKKLEDRLGHRLLERTPRSVSLTPFGEEFVEDARSVLTAHDAALRKVEGGDQPRAVSLGVSDHAAGAHLPAVLAELRRSMPHLQLAVTVGLSEQLASEFGHGKFDAVVVRRDAGPRDGRPLYRDRLGWCAAPAFQGRRHEPLPLVSLAAPCSIRSIATRALDEAGVEWTEVFAGGGVSAVQAAVEAGLGIACLGLRNKPRGAVRLGRREGLPSLPANEVVMLDRECGTGLSGTLDAVADAFRAAGEGRE